MNTLQAMLRRARAAIREIDAGTLAADPDLYLIVDVRDPGELTAGQIPGAINMSVERLVPEIGGDYDSAAVSSLCEDDREICLYCHSGGRSAIAAYALQQAGAQRVVSLAGGIVAWQAHQADGD
jgi:rhodanese-related sulfurtransferase